MTLTLDTPEMPPQAAARLEDPRLASLQYRGEGYAIERGVLPPITPPIPGESPFLRFICSLEVGPYIPEGWTNRPMASMGWGEGSGFRRLTESPRFEEPGEAPPPGAYVWEFSGWLIAAPEFVQVVRRFEPDLIETVPLDITYSDGRRLDNYAFLDVRRLIHAYDYDRSEILVVVDERGKYISGLGQQRGLRTDIGAGIHIFRDAFKRGDLFVSRELAQALVAAGVQRLVFRDPANDHDVTFE